MNNISFCESLELQQSSDSIALLNEYTKHARERREELEKDLSQRPTPQFILSIQQASVSYIIDPLMLPYSQVNFPVFSDILQKKYNLCFEKPAIPASLVALNSCEEIDARRIETLMNTEQSSSSIIFRSGRFPISRDDFVPITQIEMNRESIRVNVQSNSKVAEVIAKEVIETFWESTGSPKKWESISPMLQMIGYSTATKVDFGIPLNKFLSPCFANFFDQQVTAGSQYGSAMMTRSARHKFSPAPDTVATWAVDELHLYIYVFNKQNGNFQRCQVQFSVRTYDEENTGIFTFTSPLPFDEHIACLEKLKEYLEGSF